MIGKSIVQSEAFKTAVGFTVAMTLKFIRLTSRFEVHRMDIAQRFWANDEPFIGATWHGQNLILPTFWHNWREMRILVSRHGDGEIVSKIMHYLGVGTIRGSGVPKGEERREKHRSKGGAGALRAMVRALGENVSIGLTADLPPGPARRAGDGIIMLARLSGRPIVPVAATTRARIQLNNWDRFTINLPFSKGALVWGEPIYVPRDADAVTLEAARLSVEQALNAVAEEAERIVGRRPKTGGAGARVI
ncbi:MAG: lysophospholipid acyltransferase family protein [Pseudomonadota bacterium]